MEFVAKVYVTPQVAILDPEGKAIGNSLRSLGYSEVGDVRLGKYIVLRLKAEDAKQAEVRLDEMCRRLLANEVIEDFRFEIEVAAP